MCASTHSTVASRLSCLAPLVPLKHVRFSATCASQQRALLSNVRFSARALPSKQPLSLKFTHRTLSCASHNVHLPNRTLSLPSTQTCFLLPTPRPALFWARCNRVRQSGEDTAPFPPAAPCFGNRQMSRICWGRSARPFWRETSSRPRRVSIRPSGSVTTRCSFDGECR